jgi:hypothetical protein
MGPEHDGRRQLEVGGVRHCGGLEMGDPHGAIISSSADRAPALGHQLARRTTKFVLPVTAKEVVALTEQGVEHARMTIRAQQSSEHDLGRGRPVNCPVRLPHGRLHPAPEIGIPITRFGDIAAIREAGQRLKDTSRTASAAASATSWR